MFGMFATLHQTECYFNHIDPATILNIVAFNTL